MGKRVKCDVCGLYRGAKPHSGAVHDAIRRNRAKVKAGTLGSRIGRKLRRRR